MRRDKPADWLLMLLFSAVDVAQMRPGVYLSSDADCAFVIHADASKNMH